MTDPWLSVVSVVKDDPYGLTETMESLRCQNLEGVEVLVVDSSTDRDAARDSCSDIASVRWEEPAGIYGAMNSGLNMASGEFVQFLNAGDKLHSQDVLSQARLALSNVDTWAFGPVELISEEGIRVLTPTWNYAKEKENLFARGFFPQHQGVFARRQVLRDLGGFSMDYSIAADYRMALQLSTVGDPDLLDFIVAEFYEGGASTIGWQQAFREFHAARKEVFHPQGKEAWRERFNTTWHFGRVWLYREVVAPFKRRARR